MSVFSTGAEAPLVLRWLRGRSVARGLPQPVADCGGWRIDTASPAERRRHVFIEPGAALRALATGIDERGETRVAVRLAATPDVLAPLLPPGWRVGEEAFVMTGPVRPQGAPALPPDYRLVSGRARGAHHIRIVDQRGRLAALGFGASMGGVLVFDRIHTEPAHRRRGLGRAVMAAIDHAARQPGDLPLLVATPMGRALYTSLGWVDAGGYSSTVSPGV